VNANPIGVIPFFTAIRSVSAGPLDSTRYPDWNENRGGNRAAAIHPDHRCHILYLQPGLAAISGNSPTWSVNWDKQVVHPGDTVTATVSIGSDYHNNMFDFIPFIPGKWISVDGRPPYVLGPGTDPPDLLNDNRLSLWHAPYNFNLAGTHTVVFQVTGAAVVPCTHMDVYVYEGAIGSTHQLPVYFESLP
jgi:hypothetical protein